MNSLEKDAFTAHIPCICVLLKDGSVFNVLVLLCLTLRVTYDERGRSVHADDGAINPAKKPLHYQLNVASGWTLHRQNHLRHKHQPTHTDPVHPQHYHNFPPFSGDCFALRYFVLRFLFQCYSVELKGLSFVALTVLKVDF